ncbi:MAG: hypothetical protein R3Y04_00740 [Rikenellaceae bacterium]
MDSNDRSDRIIKLLESKSTLKQAAFSSCSLLFENLKEILHEMSGEINDTLSNSRLIKVEYRDRGKFEAQLQIATDMLIFSMHTNVFHFDREHPIYQNDYVKGSEYNSYCGVINIYDFLADSFKFNRLGDEGYLIGRIFVNHENCFFVEGKRQEKYGCSTFGSRQIDESSLQEIVEIAIEYAINFDLLVPPYDAVKIVEVDQMNTKIENSRIQTGKRLGYKFNSDDI